MGAGLENFLASVHPLFVCHTRPPHVAAVGLLLWARRPGDIDRPQQQRRAVVGGPAGPAMA